MTAENMQVMQKEMIKAGLIEEEMGEGSWLHVPFDASLIFDDRDQDDVWDDVLARTGVSALAFMMMGDLVKS